MLLTTLVACLALAQGGDGPLDITDANYEQWRSFLQPKGKEVAWERLRWRASLEEALADAKAAQKTVLVWAADGHPLGCTSGPAARLRVDLWSREAVAVVANEKVPLAIDRLKMTPSEAKLISSFDPVSSNVFAVFSPQGEVVASIESEDPVKIEEFLKKTRSLDKPSPPDGVRAQSDAPVDRRVSLRLVARDLPRKPQAIPGAYDGFNLDYGDLRAASAQQLVPQRAEVGATARMKSSDFAEWARTHLVDFARGVTLSYNPTDVHISELRSRVSKVDGDKLMLRIWGNFNASCSGEWNVNGKTDLGEPTKQIRGIDLSLLGRARFDTRARRFLSFEFVALGKRWGGTAFNGRFGDLNPQPIGFLASTDYGFHFIPSALGQALSSEPGS